MTAVPDHVPRAFFPRLQPITVGRVRNHRPVPRYNGLMHVHAYKLKLESLLYYPHAVGREAGRAFGERRRGPESSPRTPLAGSSRTSCCAGTATRTGKP